MPASAIDVSFCGAATTASTSPASASLIAVPAKASAARPLAALLVPKSSAAMSGCAQPSTLTRWSHQSASAARVTTRSSTAMAQAAAWRFNMPASPTTIALQALRTAGARGSLETDLRSDARRIPRGNGNSRFVAHAWTPIFHIGGAQRMREGAFYSQGMSDLLPGNERRVDHIGHALAAHRPDGEIHVLAPEFVGRDLLEREALRGKLRERELARLEAVAARALDCDELHRDLFERE